MALFRRNLDTPLDPLGVFEEIMKRTPQLDIQDRSRDNLHREESEKLILLGGWLAVGH